MSETQETGKRGRRDSGSDGPKCCQMGEGQSMSSSRERNCQKESGRNKTAGSQHLWKPEHVGVHVWGGWRRNCAELCTAACVSATADISGVFLKVQARHVAKQVELEVSKAGVARAGQQEPCGSSGPDMELLDIVCLGRRGAGAGQTRNKRDLTQQLSHVQEDGCSLGSLF